MALAVFRYEQYWEHALAQQMVESQEPRRLSRLELAREVLIHDQRGSAKRGDAHFLAGDPGFYNFDLLKHEFTWNTNTDRFWTHVWREGANGLRVQLILGGTNTPDGLVAVYVGSILKHAGELYYTPPGWKIRQV